MAKLKARILAVDDNAGIRSALRILLPMHFSDVELLDSPKELKSNMAAFKPDVVLLDMNFDNAFNNGNEGLFYLSEIKAGWPDTPVVLFTAYADISLAVEGMKRGATDFIVKPWDNDKLVATLRSAVEQRRRSRKRSGAEAQSAPEEPARMRWGDGAAMLSVRKMVERVAPTDASVLITGENGTGKDLLAREICALSHRAVAPLVCVDMGAVSESLFESELFGHVKGAFTDAKSDHAGKFEQANGGTIFLDEIGNIPLHLQAKLLRVLQNRSITRVGGSEEIPVDIRLICATNMDLPRMIAEGRFREDLFYRINAAEIRLPALRERPDEILPLARLFLSEFSGKYGRSATGFSAEAAQVLLSRRWNGNIRELRNVVQKAVIVSEGEEIGLSELGFSGDEVDAPGRQGGAAAGNGHSGPGLPASADENNGVRTLEQSEEQAIRDALQQCGGNLTMVAKMLGVSRPTLYSKLKKYKL